MDIVETSVWVDEINDRNTPQTRWVEAEAHRRTLGLTDLILCEVLQGAKSEKRFRQIQSYLSLFEIHAGAGEMIALASANNYRLLRSRGITVRSTMDCLIATFCIEGGHRLLHNDRDFDPFEKYLGLNVIHP